MLIRRLDHCARRTATLLITSALLLLNTSANAQATGYQLVDLGALPGIANSAARAMNSSGIVVGSSNAITVQFSLAANGTATATALPGVIGTGINDSGQIALWGGQPSQSFLFSSSTGTVYLGGLGGQSTTTTAINNMGQVVGSAKIADDPTGFVQHAVLYSGTGSNNIDLGTLGGANSFAQDINDAGLIVGAAQASGSISLRAVIFNSNGNIDLGTLGGAFGQANAVNNHGQIVGCSSWTNNIGHATLYSSSGNIDLGGLSSLVNSCAYDINNLGQVVGTSTALFGSAAFIWTATTGMVDLQTLVVQSQGWDLTEAMAINDSGQIAANGCNASGDCHALLLIPIPVPEPASCMLYIMGLLALGGIRRRRLRLSRCATTV